MTNERLRDALLRAGMTPNELAHQLGVDTKTVERWITKGRTPYQRHRHRAAAILGQSDSYLWPDALSEDRKALVAQSEVVEIFPRRVAVPSDLWTRLLDGAQSFIGILAYAGLFLPEQDPRLIHTLKQKAKDGATVVVLLGDPDCEQVANRGIEEGIGNAMAAKIHNVLAFYNQLKGTPNVFVGYHRTTLYNSIYRYDDQMLVNTHVFGFPAAHAPVIHLRRLSGGTLFDTYSDSFDRVWSSAESVWTDDEQGTVWHG